MDIKLLRIYLEGVLNSQRFKNENYWGIQFYYIQKN